MTGNFARIVPSGSGFRKDWSWLPDHVCTVQCSAMQKQSMHPEQALELKTFITAALCLA